MPIPNQQPAASHHLEVVLFGVLEFPRVEEDIAKGQHGVLILVGWVPKGRRSSRGKDQQGPARASKHTDLAILRLVDEAFVDALRRLPLLLAHVQTGKQRPCPAISLLGRTARTTASPSQARAQRPKGCVITRSQEQHVPVECRRSHRVVLEHFLEMFRSLPQATLRLRDAAEP